MVLVIAQIGIASKERSRPPFFILVMKIVGKKLKATGVFQQLKI